MPKTVQSESTNDRFNPYIKKSISKTLLTPCRQVGLSRKKKTPNSILKSSSDSVNDSSSSIVLNTTPVTSRQSSSESPNLSHETESQPKLFKSSDKVKTKKSVSKCLIVDDGSLKSDNFKSVKSPDRLRLNKCRSKHVIEDDEDEEVNLVPLKVETSKEHTVKSSNRVKTKKSMSKRLLIDDEDDEDDDVNLASLKNNNAEKSRKDVSAINSSKTEDSKEQTVESSNRVKTKSVSKRLIIDDEDDEDDINSASVKANNYAEKSSDKNVSAIDSDFDTSPVMKPNKLRQYENKSKKKSVLTEIQNESTSSSSVIAEASKEKAVVMPRTKNEDVAKREKKVKIRRSLSLKKSSEEIEEKSRSNSEDSMTQDCTVFLSPLESKIDLESTLNASEISASDVCKLEKEVQQKRKLLENLQQAEIYRKLHDVDKLEELTATWKNGCIAALNDLLPHLQTHADIDMATLLNNLRVPEKLITLSQNGDLV